MILKSIDNVEMLINLQTLVFIWGLQQFSIWTTHTSSVQVTWGIDQHNSRPPYNTVHRVDPYSTNIALNENSHRALPRIQLCVTLND